MNNDMLSRIKAKSQRPVVERDTSLISRSSETVDMENANLSTLDDLQSQVDALPKVASRRNIRLEESLDREIEDFCNQERITIETLLEGLYLSSKDDSTLKNAVRRARVRLKERKEAGKLRRIYTQLEQRTG